MTEIIDSSPAPQDGVPPAGATLKARRIELGHSLENVASQLKLTQRQIEAIENERFDELPGNTFVRGFVRNYARFLDLPWEPLHAYLEQHLPVERQQAALPRVNEEASVLLGGSRSSSSILLVLVVLVAFAAGVGGVLWFWQQPATPELLSPSPAELPKVVVLDMASEASHVAASQPASAVMAASSASAVLPVAPAVTTPASAAASMVAAATGPADLSISVQQDSWVQVQDASGAKLVSELLKPGVVKNVSGVLPYRLKIGNAPHTQLVFRNQAVDLKSYTRGDVATFELK
jgi:cytoskeleton protein RodZ